VPVQSATPTPEFTRSPYAPFLKWAGGKHRLLSQYDPFFPAEGARTYYEPFAGSAAVFFHLRGRDFAARYVLSDFNPELINVYQTVQGDVDDLLDELKGHHHAHFRDARRHYYHTRKLDRNGTWEGLTSVDRAARMLYLNRTCFNGLWRVNSRGEFNVPIGRYHNPNIINEVRLRGGHQALQGVELDVQHFREVLDFAGEGDFVYFDPPYIPLSATSNFTAYARDGFGIKDQEELADVFRELDWRGARVMLSNSDLPVVRELYHGFTFHTVQARRAINVNGNGRGPVTEVVVINYQP
jgi:DNA adenine methylase